MTIKEFMELFPQVSVESIQSEEGLYFKFIDKETEAVYEISMHDVNGGQISPILVPKEKLEEAIVFDAARELGLSEHDVDLLMQKYEM